MTSPACTISSSVYGVHNGSPVAEYTLKNANGMSVSFLTRGVTLTHVIVPDRNGTHSDVILGWNSLGEWVQYGHNFNSIVGRYANRIKDGRFVLDGKTYQLECNNGPNHLHGGVEGFYSKNFTVVNQIESADRCSVTLAYVSPDGECNYPGELRVTCEMVLTARNELHMIFGAETTAPTIVNICNHAYWNLSGSYQRDILGHKLYVNAKQCTPIDNTMIPTGTVESVVNTHMDFNTTQTIGSRIHVFKTVDAGANGGYDHNYVIDASGPKGNDGQTVHAVKISDDISGRVMDIYTSAPAIQVYTGNFLDGSIVGKESKPYAKHAGICLETQVHPNSPNVATFPSPVLRPGQVYRHTVIHAFSVAK